MKASLRITEIFYSLQGESSTVGLPTVFVRLTGCPLRCQYCDTEYAFTGGEVFTLDEILEKVSGFGASYVCVTGGEPMAQAECPGLLTALCDNGYQVSLETSGAIDLANVDKRVKKVMDIKTPDSAEADKNHWDNLKYLTSHDELKIVVCSREDYDWFKTMADAYDLFDRCPVLLSPSFGEIDATELSEWILDDRLPVRFQMQLHKILWNDEPGH